ncbi:LOW QUALITY PROTEIN: rhodanese-like domain-containing protein 7 [Dioscorea cayenensis subsp. rotundata]|uniref:LOW QUALITY PROTEIN: rhodanese-like domain-containing protein 7 n=1 Tax=Dioscorea cayennensis subsp. rotundata TaxID=55577 RepID=A0AB40BL70_DIOCR|nr:LOW QUALITY PROTEIN: rhodanese-like domain-containing protein 7 [Dioscorea cayenensis subsp. rotundata]
MLLSAPALRFANCTRAAAAAATSTALWLLCRNPNPCRPTMEAVSPKSLIAGLSNPRPLLWNPLLSQSAEPKGICSAAEQSDVSSALVVVSFYKFADFPDHAVMRMPLKDLCEELRVSGGIILAPEGINGSICGTPESVEKVLEFIQSDDRLRGLRLVESPVSPEDEAIHHGHTSHSPVGAGEDAPFRWDHVRVKLKKEIVTFGDPSIRPTERVGKYVSPNDWNTLISDPDTVVIDVRNTYETRIGKFKGAVDPCTTAFREFPAWVDDQFQLAELEEQIVNKADSPKAGSKEQNKIEEAGKLPRGAMYCTGGIRCEKASSFLLSKGFEEVYHLEGGILKYLEEVPKAESLWEGECFVFDKRVSVEHGLTQGNFKLCYGCKQPVSDEDMEAPEWEFGVSCPYCFSTKSEEEKDRARARQKQFEAWGVIGGPDKGRRKPAELQKGTDEEARQPNSSI